MRSLSDLDPEGVGTNALPLCDIFHLFTSVICYCASIALAYTPAGPLSLKQNGVFTLVISIWLHRSAHTAHIASHRWLLLISVDPRVTASTSRTAEEASLPDSGSSRKRKRSTCNRVIHFPLILSGAMTSSAVSSVLYLRDAALEIMPRRVLVRTYTTETQQVSMNAMPHSTTH